MMDTQKYVDYLKEETGLDLKVVIGFKQTVELKRYGSTSTIVIPENYTSDIVTDLYTRHGREMAAISLLQKIEIPHHIVEKHFYVTEHDGKNVFVSKYDQPDSIEVIGPDGFYLRHPHKGNVLRKLGIWESPKTLRLEMVEEATTQSSTFSEDGKSLIVRVEKYSNNNTINHVEIKTIASDVLEFTKYSVHLSFKTIRESAITYKYKIIDGVLIESIEKLSQLPQWMDVIDTQLDFEKNPRNKIAWPYLSNGLEPEVVNSAHQRTASGIDWVYVEETWVPIHPSYKL